MQEAGKGTLAEVCEKGVTDPRMDRVCKYSLTEILFVAMISVLCGARTYTQMAIVGREREEWFKRYLPYENGMPCSGTLRNVLRRIDPEQAHKIFVEWMRSTFETLRDMKGFLEGVLAFDGKTIRGSKTKDGRATHIVNAFASAVNLVIGQLAVDAKSNEITAVPEIIDMLDLSGCFVTGDALLTQTEIAEKVAEKGGNYMLQVKGNQEFLYEAVKDAFSGDPREERSTEGPDIRDRNCFRMERKGHGREEVYECWVAPGRDWMGGTADKWGTVNAAAKIRRTATENGRTTSSDHHFIVSTAKFSAEELLQKKMDHWKIEAFHWILDVQLGEDGCKAHVDNSAEILNVLRHIAHNVMRELPCLKGSFADRQMQLAMSNQKLDEAAKRMGFIPLYEN